LSWFGKQKVDRKVTEYGYQVKDYQTTENKLGSVRDVGDNAAITCSDQARYWLQDQISALVVLLLYSTKRNYY
jgi:hypothetical protein